MFRILYSDIRKIFTHWGFKVCLLVNVGYHLFTVLVLKLVSVFMLKQDIDADGVAFSYASMAAFLITASTLLTTTSEYTDGCLRNKLISGVKRYEIILSDVIGGMLQGVVHSMVAMITATVTDAIFTTGFDYYTVSEVADYWLVITLSCMAIGVFSTVLIMVLGGGRSSYVVGLTVVITLRILSLRILDKLFPTAGDVTITGKTLAIYSFTDRFVPYLHLVARPHYGAESYLIGSFGLILISTVIGIILFNRKEII